MKSDKNQSSSSTRPLNRKMYKRYKELMASSETQDTQEVLAQVLSEMRTVDTKSVEAKTNATSMDDNKGGRIIYTGTPDMFDKENKKDNK